MRNLVKLILAASLAVALSLIGVKRAGAQPSFVPPSSPPQLRNAERRGGQFLGLPVAAEAAVSAALGREDARYQVAANGVLEVRDPVEPLRAAFTPQGIRVEAGGGQWRLAFQGWGYGDRLAQGREVKPRHYANRVEYQRGSLVEWYVNGPAGLEQGFTVSARPASGVGNSKLEASHSSPLTIAMAVRGNLTAVAGSPGNDVGRVKDLTLRDANGHTVLRYTGLDARDASGRELAAWMELKGHDLLLRVDAAGARYPVVIDPMIEVAKLTASKDDPDPTGRFGFSVSISSDGSTIAVGAPYARIGSNVVQGAVYVFAHTSRGWSQTAKLTAPDGIAGAQFGRFVSISGDGSTIVAGGVGSFFPHAYVFTKSGSSWTQTAELNVSAFGVAINGDATTIAVGNPGANGDKGEVCVFSKGQGGWSQTATLTGSDAVSTSYVGLSVSISEDGGTIVAGAINLYTASAVGAAYVFTNTGGSWDQAAKLTALDGARENRFGSSVSVSNNGGIIVVGSGVRAAYVFAASQSGWTQTAKLTGDRYFANSVAVSADGNSIAVGGLRDAKVFFNDGNKWNEDADLHHEFSSVSLSNDGGTLVAGESEAPPVSYSYDAGSREAQIPSGAAYVYVAGNRP